MFQHVSIATTARFLLKRFCVILVFLSFTLSAYAHEFWLWPKAFELATGDIGSLGMRVGENFTGEVVPFSTRLVANLRRYSVDTSDDLLGYVPDNAALTQLKISFPIPGTQMIAFDSNPIDITLPADKFEAYLHSEGLDAIIGQRRKAGATNAAGRERFRRNAKTFLRVGGQSDATYSIRTHQRLEIVPLTDPSASAYGDTLGFKLYFDDKPLPHALVKAWHKHGNQEHVISASSNDDGIVDFTLLQDGPWMISVVHMIPAIAAPNVDWESFWGNLSFNVTTAKVLSSRPY